MQTHLLIMILLLVCVVQAAMAGYVPNLVLLNEQHRPPVIVMPGENKSIKYAYDMILYDMTMWKCTYRITPMWFPSAEFWQAFQTVQFRISRVRGDVPKFSVIWIYQYQCPLGRGEFSFHRINKSSQDISPDRFSSAHLLANWNLLISTSSVPNSLMV